MYVCMHVRVCTLHTSPETKANTRRKSGFEGWWLRSKIEYIPSRPRCTLFHLHFIIISHSSFKGSRCDPEWFHFAKKFLRTSSWCLSFVTSITKVALLSIPAIGQCTAYLGRINLRVKQNLEETFCWPSLVQIPSGIKRQLMSILPLNYNLFNLALGVVLKYHSRNCYSAGRFDPKIFFSFEHTCEC